VFILFHPETQIETTSFREIALSCRPSLHYPSFAASAASMRDRNSRGQRHREGEGEREEIVFDFPDRGDRDGRPMNLRG